MQSRIMYMEFKGDGLTGPGRIGRVTLSKSGKTLHCGGHSFQSLTGGYKANCVDVDGVRNRIGGLDQSPKR